MTALTRINPMSGILILLLCLQSSAQVYMPQNISVNAGPGDQSETAIVVDPNNPNHLMATYDDGYNNTYTVPGFSFSTDGGNNWSAGGQISKQNRGQYNFGFNPSCGIDKSGNEYYSFATINTGAGYTPNAVFICVSRDDGNNWLSYQVSPET